MTIVVAAVMDCGDASAQPRFVAGEQRYFDDMVALAELAQAPFLLDGTTSTVTELVQELKALAITKPTIMRLMVTFLT